LAIVLKKELMKLKKINSNNDYEKNTYFFSMSLYMHI